MAHADVKRTVRLGDILAEPPANGRSVPTAHVGVPVLRLNALRGRGVDISQRKIGAWSETEAAPFRIRKGDFLLSRGNGTLSLVGRGGLVADEPDFVAYPDTMIRLRLDVNKIDSRYFSLVWSSRLVRNQIESAARTTAGIYKVNQKILGNVEIPFPSLNRQIEIADELADVEGCTARLMEQMTLLDSRAGQLRKTLLAEAFAGRLVAQDPADESASVLLERIRAERAGAAKVPRRRAPRLPTKDRKPAAATGAASRPAGEWASAEAAMSVPMLPLDDLGSGKDVVINKDKDVLG
ncbi:restriction endonuclease subunit S [Frankia sp. ACN1ag]|uniref:restriction endonuclease subunit S n=1 Tax=Frankia sp. ACN1ag TaxID=102891 RepID=UPI001F00FED6|nr:restriction endonuclease subunit S [Frankia sp. ACN1ag]